MKTEDSRRTQITTLPLDDPEPLIERVERRCDRALALGYRLSAAYPHLGRLVLVFQNADAPGNPGQAIAV